MSANPDPGVDCLGLHPNINVAMIHADRNLRNAEIGKVHGETFGEGYAAVFAAGAADADAEVVLSFLVVFRKQELMKIDQLVEEDLGIGIFEDVIGNRRLQASAVFELRIEEGIPQKPHVEDGVSWFQKSVFETETGDVHMQLTADETTGITFLDFAREEMNTPRGCIEGNISQQFNALQRMNLPLDASNQLPTAIEHRMLAAGGAITFSKLIGSAA